METRTLHSTALNVSRVCFGTMTFGGQTDEAASKRMIDYCLDCGINFFDTANMYNKGVSEEILGRALSGRRDRAIVATKVRFRMGDEPDMGGLSRAAVMRAIDDSLRRLRMDYVDLYYLHFPDYDARIEETLDALHDLVKAGKIRYTATSNYAGWQVAQMFCICERKGYEPPRVSQHMYNLLARGVEQEYLPMCKDYGVAAIVYNPLAGGLLTGKQTPQAPLPGTRFDNNKMYLDRYWHPQYFKAVEELKGIAARIGRSLISLSLCWLQYHTATDCIILGASKQDHLEQNLKALDDGPLDEETVKACDEVWRELRGPTPNYNR
jgi:aryl-alcohol dehydrogenase-like predicted oxidoreductase